MVMTQSNYSIVRSRKARSMRISIYPNCEVKVTAPFFLPEFLIKRFVVSKNKWIEKKLKHFKKHPISPKRLLLNSLGRKDFVEQKEKALQLVKERLLHFNRHYGLTYHKITIRNQKSRWGSCSHNGNINFNYKIVFLEPEMQDYIVVHELCHLKELNHGKSFWDLVGETIKDYKKVRGELRSL